VIWQNGARSAFSMGFDLDGDTIWNNKSRRMPGGQWYIKGPSIGQYGTNKGVLRVLEVLEEYDFKATWFVPALIAQKHWRLIEEILSRGHELAHHGYDHTGEYGSTFEAQQAHLELCQEIFMQVAGRKAVGLRATGALLPETERWAIKAGGIRYISAGLSGEACAPYEIEGVPTGALSIPCRDEQMDDYVQTVFHAYPPVLEGMPRIAPYGNACANWIHEIEAMVRYGNSGSSAFHPQIAGTPGRAMILRRFCEYLRGKPEVWVTSCEEIADYYLQHGEKGAGEHAN